MNQSSSPNGHIWGKIAKEGKGKGGKCPEYHVYAAVNNFYIKSTSPVESETSITIGQYDSSVFKSYLGAEETESTWTVTATSGGGNIPADLANGQRRASSIKLGENYENLLEPGIYEIKADKDGDESTTEDIDTMELIIIKVTGIKAWDSDNRYAENSLLEVVPPETHEKLFGEAIISPENVELPYGWPVWSFDLSNSSDSGEEVKSGRLVTYPLTGYEEKGPFSTLKNTKMGFKLKCNKEMDTLININVFPFNSYKHKKQHVEVISNKVIRKKLNEVLSGFFNFTINFPRWDIDFEEQWKERVDSNKSGWTYNSTTKGEAGANFDISMAKMTGIITRKLQKATKQFENLGKAVRLGLNLIDFDLNGELGFTGSIELKCSMDEYGNTPPYPLDKSRFIGNFEFGGDISLGAEMDPPFMEKIRKAIQSKIDQISKYNKKINKLQNLIDHADKFNDRYDIIEWKREINRVKKLIKKANKTLKDLLEELEFYKKLFEKLEIEVEGNFGIKGKSYIELYDLESNENAISIKAKVVRPAKSALYKMNVVITYKGQPYKLVDDSNYKPIPGLGSKDSLKLGTFQILTF